MLLLDQNRARWDQILIRRGLAALARAEALGEARGPYVLQAAITACHARAQRPEDTDWAGIAALYGELVAVMPSPVVELNRAVAVSMAEGPLAGLALVDALSAEPALQNYHSLPSARADLLSKLGRFGGGTPRVRASRRPDTERAPGASVSSSGRLAASPAPKTKVSACCRACDVQRALAL